MGRAQAEPVGPLRDQQSDALGLRLGAVVSVSPDDYARDGVTGELVALNVDRIALHRQVPGLGSLAVHFPRLGYTVRAAP